jgi:mannose-6-phosphate isomerase-like protein (cupin superfamily)
VINKVNLGKKFGLFSKLWNPKIVGEMNNAYVKIVKIKGEFVWHRHDAEDEMFFIVKGNLVIKIRDTKEREIFLSENEFVIIPKGVEHMPVAEDEVWLMVIEPKTTINTGNVTDDRTVEEPEWI